MIQDKIVKIVFKILAILSLMITITTIVLGILFKLESWEDATGLLLIGFFLIILTVLLFWKALSQPSIMYLLSLVLGIISIVIGLLSIILSSVINSKDYYVFPYEILALGITVAIYFLQFSIHDISIN